jgi:hypothetical protein
MHPPNLALINLGEKKRISIDKRLSCWLFFKHKKDIWEAQCSKKMWRLLKVTMKLKVLQIFLNMSIQNVCESES